jgi:hypothetical protein
MNYVRFEPTTSALYRLSISAAMKENSTTVSLEPIYTISAAIVPILCLAQGYDKYHLAPRGEGQETLNALPQVIIVRSVAVGTLVLNLSNSCQGHASLVYLRPEVFFLHVL